MDEQMYGWMERQTNFYQVIDLLTVTIFVHIIIFITFVYVDNMYLC